MMKIQFAILATSLLFVSGGAWAQKTSLTEIPMSEDTTISIKKGQAASQCEKLFEIVEGKAQVEGEASVLAKDARKNWKKACEDWKKETKEMNKGNQILLLDCGKSTCSLQGSEGQICTSEASFKVKTKIN